MTTRRDLLKGGLAAGGLVATASLPSAAADVPELFPRRGRYERLSLTYRHIGIGLGEPFAVLHISDTHLTEAYDAERGKHAFRDMRRQTFGGLQHEALESSLAWAKENVDCVLHTGDLIDFQSQANLDCVRRCFGEAAGTMFGAMGNHEYQRDIRERGVKQTTDYNRLSYGDLRKAYPFDPVFASTVVKGVNFVTIDDVYGFVTEEQVERFRQEVGKGLPIVLCLHVPFFSEDIWRAYVSYWWRPGKKFDLRDLPEPGAEYKRQQEDPVTRGFIASLRREPLLRGILSGHLHLEVAERFSPTAEQYVVGGNFLFHGQVVCLT